ncbi:hypothetical protein [Thalassoroseus pseudoceratinae]|uniref:hypothetical protein n=1 Tax=Thalassoroseus pseudoceratinae TaxID=2713176 RepID=UPI00142016B8|nr:hypothetical protein [Thalassoroseus pseudoceratinae]
MTQHHIHADSNFANDLVSVSTQPSQASPAKRAIASCGLLTATVVLALPLALWFFESRYGVDGAWAAGFAALICWLGGLLALAVHVLFRKPQHAIAAAFGGMLVRTAFVFTWALIILKRWEAAEQSGFRFAVVAFFLLTLTAETALSLWLMRSQLASTSSNEVEAV